MVNISTGEHTGTAIIFVGARVLLLLERCENRTFDPKTASTAKMCARASEQGPPGFACASKFQGIISYLLTPYIGLLETCHRQQSLKLVPTTCLYNFQTHG